MVASIWGLGAYKFSMAQSEEVALWWFKIAHISVILTPAFYSHFVFHLTKNYKRSLVVLTYLLATIFLGLNFFYTDFFELQFSFDQFYFFRGAINKHLAYFIFYILFYWLLLFYAFFLLIKFFKQTTGKQRNQIKYFFIGSLVAWLGPEGMFLYVIFGLPIYPYSNILIGIFPLIIAYAIFKYQLMDIRAVFKVAISRVGLLVLVYASILVFPFWLAHRTNTWLIPISIMFLLATAGPFIFNYLRHKAEAILLKEQKRYQSVLQGLGSKMSQIKKEMDRILKTIVTTVYQEVKPEFVAIYTYSKANQNYSLKDKYPSRSHASLPEAISPDFPLVQELHNHKIPVISEHFGTSKISHEILAVPFFVENNLASFLILGPRIKKAIYTQDDIETFNILSNQISLAIENCLFWQEEQVNEQIRRQRSMDHFSASMAHEILNPVSGVIGTIEGLKMTIREDWKKTISSDKQEYLNQKLTRSTHNLMRISKMIDAIKEFSRKTQGNLTLLNINEVIEGFFYMFEPQLKYKEINFSKDIDSGLYILGNKIHLQEVLLNLGNNAVDALETTKLPKEKKITLKIHKDTPNTCLISFKDNGCGIKPDLIEDIFLDFVTTKASTQGTGMGLARVRKIIQNHQGEVWAESPGEGEGAEFFVRLPLKSP